MEYVEEIEKRLRNVEHLLNVRKDVLTVDEAAAYMGVRRATLYRMVKSRTIPYYIIKETGYRKYFNRSELESWLLQNRVTPKTEI